jgi:PKD repeat protein
MIIAGPRSLIDWASLSAEGPEPVADFSGTPLSGVAPLSVVFTDLSTNTPSSWLWEKSSNGGASWSNFSGTPTVKNPSESFAQGTWDIRLTATNASGSGQTVKSSYVVAGAVPSTLGTWKLGSRAPVGTAATLLKRP